VARRFILLGGLVVALAASGAAEASWRMGGTGNGYSKAATMPGSSAPTHTIATWPNVALSWTAGTVGGAPVSFLVRRYAEGGTTAQAIGAACSGTVATNACTENGVPVGRWQYTTQATKGSWIGAESVKSSTVEIAAAPTSLTCPLCHTYGTTTYINAANATNVQLKATFAATSLATDAANLSLTDSANHTVSTSSAAPAGAGTVSFPSLSTSTLTDGTVTAGAHVTANTGDLSPTTSLGLVRDTVSPSAANVLGANGSGSTAKKVDNGDTLTYTFSEPVDPGTIASGWTGSSKSVSATLSSSGSSTTVAVANTNLGTVNTQANYVVLTVTCSSSTMAMSGSVVTVTLGGCGGALALLLASTNVTPSKFVWTPTTTVTDLAGNPMSATAVTGSTGGF
jgi:hypothetical protein